MIHDKKTGQARRGKLIGGIVLLLALFVLAFGSLRAKGNEPLTVCGYPISEEYVNLYEDDCRAAVESYFYQTYGADPNGTAFWSQSFDGEVPQEMLREQALSRLVSDVVMRAEARERGIEADVTYDELVKALEAENEVRASGKSYGPDTYSLLQYIEKTDGQILKALKEEMLADDFKPTDEDLEAIYKEQQDALDMGYQAKLLLFMYTSMKAGSFPEGLSEALLEAGQAWESGEGQDAIAAQLQDKGYPIDCVALTIDTENQQKDNEETRWLLDVCAEIEEGAVSEVVTFVNQCGIACVEERTDYGVPSFADARQYLEVVWINEQYETYMEQKVDAALQALA